MNKAITRRNFLKASAATALTARSYASVLGANDTIRLALIGCSSQGVLDLRECLSVPNTKAVAVCDIDQIKLKKGLKRADELGQKPDGVADFRRIVERNDIDAVIIATPDHWHAIPALQAMRAGKDLYLEKPIGHTIHEGQLMVKTAAQTKRVVSVGLQQRTGALFLDALNVIQSGKLGKVSSVHCWNAWNDKLFYEGGYRQLKNKPNAPVPDGVDYDFWLGPAPKRDFNEDRYNGTYLYFWDYSGGMSITWGVHLIDSAMHLMGVEAPTAVTSVGNKFVLKDTRDTPDTLEEIFEFPNFMLTYSCRHANSFTSGSLASDHGIQFFGTEGTMLLNRDGYKIIGQDKKETVVESAKGLDAGWGTHQRNFIEAMRSRKATNCTMLQGHQATTACQLANISYRTGRKIRWDAAKEQIIGDAQASRLMTKQYRAPWSLS